MENVVGGDEDEDSIEMFHVMSLTLGMLKFI